MPKREVEFFIIDVLIALDTVKRKTQSLCDADQLLHDEDAWLAVTRSLEIVGEAMKMIVGNADLKPFIKSYWRDVVDFRNVVAHEYFGLNAEQIFDIAKKDVPDLEQDMISLINQHKNRTMICWTIDQAKTDLEHTRRVASLKYLEDIEAMLCTPKIIKEQDSYEYKN